MRFCPVCEVKLKRNGSALECPKCGHAEGQASSSATKPKEEEFESEFDAFAENEGNEALPTVEIKCEKCGNNEAIWWMLQTRSADEPTTQFYRCTKCKHTWRDYA